MYQVVIQISSPKLSTHAIALQTYCYFQIILLYWIQAFVLILNGLTYKTHLERVVICPAL